MYSSLNKRFVKLGLGLTLGNTVTALLVANFYPFGVNVWMSSVTLALVPVLGIWPSVISSITGGDGKNVLGWWGVFLLITGVMGGFSAICADYYMTSGSSLLWALYVQTIAANIITPALLFLFTPEEESATVTDIKSRGAA